MLKNYFEGSTKQKDDQSHQDLADSLTEGTEGNNKIADNQSYFKGKMTETAVSFVLGDPDPKEELEIEDSFPEPEANDRIQQPILPGLVERRKRLR